MLDNSLILSLLDPENSSDFRAGNFWMVDIGINDPLFFLISRLNYACSPLVINLRIY